MFIFKFNIFFLCDNFQSKYEQRIMSIQEYHIELYHIQKITFKSSFASFFMLHVTLAAKLFIFPYVKILFYIFF